ncbi:EAL domain-containing protein [Leptolyngbya sp. DQ-M1]|uniref:EAL domain-containing protein n=1 Tax=Leptolyngbya sp. DQ-M1 TaxID=2933920 RepID=UPI00329980F1
MQIIPQSSHLFTLIVQPSDRETRAVLYRLGFEKIAVLPQLLYRSVSQFELSNLFAAICQHVSNQAKALSRYLVTRSVLDLEHLLSEFHSAQSLKHMMLLGKHTWFFQVLSSRQLFFNYQPIFDLHSGQVVAHECLAHARNEEGQLFNGQQLIDAALMMNLTREFDTLARSMCFNTLAQWNQPDRPTFFINVLPNAIAHHPESLEQNFQQVLDLGLHPEQIVFELTEVEALTQHPNLPRVIEQIRAGGFGLALDDLGSNVGIDHYCTELRPDVIKLDRRLIHRCSRYEMKQVMVKSLVQVAKEFGITVLAEGLEAVEDIEFCRSIGVDLGQGFGLGMPSRMPIVAGSLQSGAGVIDQASVN